MLELADARILIVDDEIEVLDLLSIFFQTFKFKVTRAQDGVQAWELIEKNFFNIVITDVNMPKMNGIELLRRIRSLTKKQPVVFVASGDTDPTEIYDLGAAGFFQKPFGTHTIREAIQRAFLAPVDLWRVRIPTAMRIEKISLMFRDLQDLAGSSQIRFGYGGFAAPGNSFPQGAQVEFHLQFSKSEIVDGIKGQGIVRWSRKDCCGIEIQYVAEEARRMFSDWIVSQGFTSFIPKG